MERRLTAIYEQAVHQTAGLSEGDRLLLLEEWLAFASDQGGSVALLRDLAHEHRVRAKTGATSGLKRSHEEVPSQAPPQAPAQAAPPHYGGYDQAQYAAYAQYYGYPQ